MKTPKKRRPNPLKTKPREKPKGALLIEDALFLHHLAGMMLRALELTDPEIFASMDPETLHRAREIASTVNSDSPDSLEGPKASK